ncbi:MAG: zinc ribbon domain-containing protein [Actinobacteria bacterium]|nr:zinc ribbon domain-containing protein [Actinomycetota bacterium]
MRFCENCGFRLPNPDARFCRNCGASLVEEEGAPAQPAPPAAPTPPAAETQPPQQAETPPPQAAKAEVPQQVPVPQAPADAAQAKPAGRSKVNLGLGIVVAVQLVAIVVLALLLAFSGGTEAEEAAPEATQDPRLVLAQEYVRAMQEEDIDAYIVCMDTSQMTKSDIEDYKDLIEEAFDLADIDITDVEFEVTEISESRAEVVTVSGTLEVLSEEELTTIDFSEEPVTIKMKKSGGEWLISEDPAVELGWEIAF